MSAAKVANRPTRPAAAMPRSSPLPPHAQSDQQCPQGLKPRYVSPSPSQITTSDRPAAMVRPTPNPAVDCLALRMSFTIRAVRSSSPLGAPSAPGAAPSASAAAAAISGVMMLPDLLAAAATLYAMKRAIATPTITHEAMILKPRDC